MLFANEIYKYVRNSHKQCCTFWPVRVAKCMFVVVHDDKTRNWSYFSLGYKTILEWLKRKIHGSKMKMAKVCVICYFENAPVSHRKKKYKKVCALFDLKMFKLMQLVVYGWEWGDGLVDVTTHTHTHIIFDREEWEWDYHFVFIHI